MGGQYGFAVGVLRCGAFHAADAVHTRMMAEGLAGRIIPIVGRGGAVWAVLHVDDAAGGFVAAVGAGPDGLWHVVDDHPAPVGEVLKDLARA